MLYNWPLTDHISYMDINRMHLCLKVNKRQQKCHKNRMGGIPERRITTRCIGVWKNLITMEDFNPRVDSSKKWERSKPAEEWLNVILAQGWELGKSLNYTRLANVESKYDPRRKQESLVEAPVANWPVSVLWRKHEEKTKMIKCFKSALCQLHKGRAKKKSSLKVSLSGVNLSSSLSILTFTPHATILLPFHN